MTFEIETYRPTARSGEVLDLWHLCFDATWRVGREDFESILMAEYRSGDHSVAVSGGRIVGFVATQTRSVPGETSPRGEMMAVFVHPDYRRSGIGRRLLHTGMGRLRACGVERVQAGGGGTSYFWPGIPVAAWPFFEACGWEDAERSYDLLGDVSSFDKPAFVTERVDRAGVSVGRAAKEDGAGLETLVTEHFPAWAEAYVSRVERGDLEDVVVARSGDGTVIGMTSAEMPPAVHWAMLRADTGSIGALGVRPDRREQGIGLALAAEVSALLCERGVKRCFVGWTWLVDWYGRLGYEVWQEYVMSWRAPTEDG